MTYESLHDDDDFRVNWCRKTDSFLFICARDDHAAPHLSLCASPGCPPPPLGFAPPSGCGLPLGCAPLPGWLNPPCNWATCRRPPPTCPLLSTWLIWSAIQQTNRTSKSRHTCIHDPQNGVCSRRNAPFLEYALFGMCSKQEVSFLGYALMSCFRMWSGWNVIKTEWALFGKCLLWNVLEKEWILAGMWLKWNVWLFLNELFLTCSQNKICPFWNVIKPALFGICSTTKNNLHLVPVPKVLCHTKSTPPLWTD